MRGPKIKVFTGKVALGNYWGIEERKP